MAFQPNRRKHTTNMLYATAAIYCLIGILVGALGIALASPAAAPSRVLRIICESGSFEAVTPSKNDPYLREEAVCNVNDSNGREIRVLLID